MNILNRAVDDVRTDYTWNRVGRLTVKGARALPSGTVSYITDKVPVIGWLPRYEYRWLINDLVAGLTLGLMLIPQSLSYAKIATIPVQYGLMSSYIPATLYTFMGTSKDLSTGPTSLIGLTTAEAVDALSKDGYSPQQIASAIAMWMGIYGMILGFLKLGWLLEFISLPILTGFISAVAITIGLGQVDNLLGEENVRNPTGDKIYDIFHQLPQANGYACAIGFCGIVYLVALDHVGRRWGNKAGKFATVAWFFSITRAFTCLILFTGIGYAVNHNRGSADKYLFDVAQVEADGIQRPQVPSATLLRKAAPHSIAAFIGPVLEHLAIGRGFGVKNNYVTDQTQELCYFGVCNFFNSFFHVMGVGGAMSRTAVNSACKVKSPLSGLVTTAVVLVCIFKLTSPLYWVPEATLAAIIITAVAPLVSSPKVFYHYWKTSLADFLASQLAFWFCLFETTYIGLGAAVAFNIVYVLVRQVFARVSSVSTDGQLSELTRSLEAVRGLPTDIPPDVRVFRFNESFFFPNAYRLATSMLDDIQTHHAPVYSSLHGSEAERNWSVVGEERVAKLRKSAKITDPGILPPISVVVLDFTKCNHFDITALANLRQLISEFKKYGGSSVEVRFTAMSDYVRSRFERAKPNFVLADGEAMGGADVDAAVVRYYDSLVDAIFAPRSTRDLEPQEKKREIELVEESEKIA